MARYPKMALAEPAVEQRHVDFDIGDNGRKWSVHWRRRDIDIVS
jgi:hypothetical protein